MNERVLGGAKIKEDFYVFIYPIIKKDAYQGVQFMQNTLSGIVVTVVVRIEEEEHKKEEDRNCYQIFTIHQILR